MPSRRALVGTHLPETFTTVVTSPSDQTSTTPPIMIPNPNGDGSMVPCEGSICTNPNHGAGEDNQSSYGPPEPGQSTFSPAVAGAGAADVQ